MREILFRGKTKGTCASIEGYYFKTDNRRWDRSRQTEDWIAVTAVQNGGRCDIPVKYAVIPETVGQYTGLNDRNGKRSFEGDFVRWPGRKEVGLVQYGEFNCSCCEGVFGWHFGTEDIREHDYYEVIGNIHDNPELMREAQ